MVESLCRLRIKLRHVVSIPPQVIEVGIEKTRGDGRSVRLHCANCVGRQRYIADELQARIYYTHRDCSTMRFLQFRMTMGAIALAAAASKNE